MAAVHAYEARKRFVDCIRHGAANVDLAEAALAVCAEDDALVTHSTVKFPIEAYRERIRKLAQQCATQALAALPPSRTPRDVATAVARHLREEQRLRLPDSGRSALPQNSVVDHAGVWEDARLAYLHEVLIRRVGSPAALAIVHYDVLRCLFLSGAIDFAVRINCRTFDEMPVAEPLALPAAMLRTANDGMLNTCTTDALVEVLRHLKRAYWPFAWDTSLDPPHGQGVGSQGGFRAAAREAIEGPVNAQIQAIARTAAHRLERGVWTSPGAGDIRRALAAAERLVLLCGSAADWERRDLGVLYMFRGMPERAKVELALYAQSEHARNADAVDKRYVSGLLEVLRDVAPAHEDEAMSIGLYLDQPGPDPDRVAHLPLTW